MRRRHVVRRRPEASEGMRRQEQLQGLSCSTVKQNCMTCKWAWRRKGEELRAVSSCWACFANVGNCLGKTLAW